MLVAKSPYRISISGGSTDYSSFYQKYTSLLVGFSLNKYCYVSIKPLPKIAPTNFEIFYSSTEKVHSIEEIQNPTVRGTLQYFKSKYNDLNKISIYIANDLSHQSGLATSSALVISLLRCLYGLYESVPSKKQLAEEAVYIERILLNQAGGVQDSYWCSYGGFNSININTNGNVIVRPLPISEDFIKRFSQSSLLFFLSSDRSSYEVAMSHDRLEAEEFKHKILEISYKTKKAFENEDIEEIGNLLNQSWLNKKQISSLISNPYIDAIHNNIMNAGAFGMKICGAGSGGFAFTMFDESMRQQIIEAVGLPYIDVGIDNLGSRIIFNE